MKQKRSTLLIIAMVLGVGYAVYSLWYWFGGGAAAQVGSDSAAQLGGAIATALVMPHLVATLVAAIFNVLGVAMSKAGFALTAGILYAVAMVLFPSYAPFVLIEAVLCFIAFARMRGAASSAASHQA